MEIIIKINSLSLSFHNSYFLKLRLKPFVNSSGFFIFAIAEAEKLIE